MGVQHFKLSMLPRAHFERLSLPIPSVLSEEEMNRGDCSKTGWWSCFQPSEPALKRLRQLCPTNKSWSETEEYITSETWGSDLCILKEHGRIWLVTFRFAPITDDRALLDRFVAIARDEQRLLLNEKTGSLFEPNDDLVAEHLRGSRAMRFISDPQQTIIEVARETPQ